MLVTAKVDGLDASQRPQGLVPTRLGPAVAIEVRQEAVVTLAVHVDGTAERRGGKDGLATNTDPVLGPGREELKLALPEEL